jgi:hypothetical protein
MIIHVAQRGGQVAAKDRAALRQPLRKAAFVGYNGERIREDIALLVSGLYGVMIGLVVLWTIE